MGWKAREDNVSSIATIGHTAVKVRDITGMIALLKDLLGFEVIRTMGEGETPSNVWFAEGLQLVHEPDFEGPEGRIHHLGVLVADRDAMVQECEKRGFYEVRPNWYALPDGLVLEFLPME
jgi:catechol 2,3-dioxygenase-like lactoylglutathione lyase family enzyme